MFSSSRLNFSTPAFRLDAKTVDQVILAHETGTVPKGLEVFEYTSRASDYQ